MRLLAGTYNLRGGGIDDGDDTRLGDQLDMLNGLGLDLLGLQEAKWGRGGKRRLEQVAQRLGMTGRLVRSSFHGCDLAVLVRERTGLRLVKERHLTGPPFVHAHADVELDIAGWPRPVRFMVGHLAPASGTTRLCEAEMVGVYRDLDVIYVADCNAIAANEVHFLGCLDPERGRGKLDIRAAQALADAGFIDVGFHRGDATPTVGHDRPDRLAHRCDRVYATLPRSVICGYRVVQETKPRSDHLAVVAEFDLDA